MNRRTDAMDRFAERRRQEDAAPRLRDMVPRLTACRIVLEETREDVTSASVAHTRRLVVERAPALLIIPCTDALCKDGGHDISANLLRGLRDGLLEIRGEDTCHGYVGGGSCGRLLKFTAFAEYTEGPA
jgi:hypothetical protein